MAKTVGMGVIKVTPNASEELLIKIAELEKELEDCDSTLLSVTEDLNVAVAEIANLKEMLKIANDKNAELKAELDKANKKGGQ